MGLWVNPREVSPLTLARGEGDVGVLAEMGGVALVTPVEVHKVVTVPVPQGDIEAVKVVPKDTVWVGEADPHMLPPPIPPRVDGEVSALALTEEDTLGQGVGLGVEGRDAEAHKVWAGVSNVVTL